MTPQATANRTWIGWIVVSMFIALLLHVGVTGRGLGVEPTPVPRTHASEVPGARTAHVTAPGNSSPQVSSVGVGTADWLTRELRHMGVLAADEQLIAGNAEAWPNCGLVVVSSAGAYRGRMCNSGQGVFRLTGDGTDTGLRWQYSAEHGWIVAVQADRPAPAGQQSG